jgi:hypothetical protein
MSPQTSQAIEDRCENWGAWARGRGSWVKSTRSLEGLYRSPQQWEALPPGTWRITDPVDAQVVESAASAVGIYPHMILRLYYVRNAEPVVCLRLAEKAAGKPREAARHWAARFREAHEALDGMLALPSVIRKERARAIVLAAVSKVFSDVD